MHRTTALSALLLATGVAACESGTLPGGLDESTFVATMGELHRVNQASLDSVSVAQARDSILQSRGLTPEQLAAAASSLAADPNRAIRIWSRIRAAAEAPAASDTATRDTAQDPRMPPRTSLVPPKKTRRGADQRGS